MLPERNRKPFSAILRSFTANLEDKENKPFRRETDKMLIEEE